MFIFLFFSFVSFYSICFWFFDVCFYIFLIYFFFFVLVISLQSSFFEFIFALPFLFHFFHFSHTSFLFSFSLFFCHPMSHCRLPASISNNKKKESKSNKFLPHLFSPVLRSPFSFQCLIFYLFICLCLFVFFCHFVFHFFFIFPFSMSSMFLHFVHNLFFLRAASKRKI